MTTEQIKYITYALYLRFVKHKNPDIDFIMQANNAGISMSDWKAMNDFAETLEEQL